MSLESMVEARRQLEICNACRYCEGYCSVFPALQRRREYANPDIRHLANLCHNCRGCYYACQYTEPHEFALNIPAILAEARQQSWQEHAVPSGFARTFQRSGAAIGLAIIAGLTLLILAIHSLGSWQGKGFYGILSHNMMIAIFIPAFVSPIVSIVLSVKRYWKSTAGKPLALTDLRAALAMVANMRDLSGGHGDGCNFEDQDRFSNVRRWLHQATMYGFLLCFAATSVATVMFYFFNLPAPYSFFSLPKLLGIGGGLLLCIGSMGLAILKLRADPELDAKNVWGGEMGFVLLLFLVSATGLVLYWLGGSRWLAELLALHLGSVLAFFLLMPYSKMVHGFYRFVALTQDASEVAEPRVRSE